MQPTERVAGTSRYWNAAILCVFLLPIVAYWAYGLLAAPVPHYDGIDPEYEYFLNSLAPFKHQGYAYVDHPGTPVELVGTGLLAATYPWLAGHAGGFTTFQLQNPRVFFSLAYAFLIAAHLVCMLLLFRTARGDGERKRNAAPAAAIATFYFAVQPYAYSGSLLWSHNSFSFPLGGLLLVALYLAILRQHKTGQVSVWAWVGLGLGTGVLAAITIFLASWVAGIVTTMILYAILSRIDWKTVLTQLSAFGTACIAGFYLAVAPVLGRMMSFWNWIYSILSHRSDYLAVPSNQSMAARVSGNLVTLFQMLPELCISIVVALGIVVVMLVLHRNRLRERPQLWALAGGLIAHALALSLVFLDRPLRAYYFLGVAAIMPVLALVILQLLEGHERAYRVFKVGISVLVLAAVIANAVQAIDASRMQARVQAGSGARVQQVITGRASELGRPAGDLVILWMYGTYSPCWALWFANHRAADAFDQEIARLCPNQYELTGRVLMPNAKMPLESTQWDIVFTCERYTDGVLAKVPGASVQTYPDIEWTCGKMAAVFNR